MVIGNGGLLVTKEDFITFTYTLINFMKDNSEGSEPIKLTPPIWYSENEMYQWLIRENYSEQIAKELSKKWADDLQGAFNKGFEKALRQSEQQLNQERNRAIDDFLQPDG